MFSKSGNRPCLYSVSFIFTIIMVNSGNCWVNITNDRVYQTNYWDRPNKQFSSSDYGLWLLQILVHSRILILNSKKATKHDLTCPEDVQAIDAASDAVNVGHFVNGTFKTVVSGLNQGMKYRW